MSERESDYQRLRNETVEAVKTWYRRRQRVSALTDMSDKLDLSLAASADLSTAAQALVVFEAEHGVAQP